jgi:hypothetical protein
MTSHSDRCPTCKRRHKRSNPQNALYWSLLAAIADKVKPGGASYSMDQWHLYCRSRWLGCEDSRLPNGKTLTIPRSTAGLDVAEFSDYFEKVQAWAAERDVWLEDMAA